VAYWGLLVVAFAVMLVMNVLTPFKEDDMGFTLIEGVWTPVRSLGDFLQSHLTHYSGTNGRLADLVPELFAGLLGKPLFNVFNAAVFAIMAHLVTLLSTGRRSLLALTAFLAIVGTCYPVPGETMLWMAGSANYMWAITLSLALAWYLQRHHGQSLGWGRMVLLFVVALVAGGFNEATSLGFLAGWILYYLFNREKLDRRSVVALTGYALGILLIFSSPGLWHRVSTDLAMDMTPADMLASRWHIFADKMWRFYLPIVALALGIILLLSRRGRVIKCSLWTYVFLCLALFMFALGLHHERAYSPLATVAVIIILAVADVVLAGRWQRLRQVAVVLALGLTIFTYARGVRVLSQYKAYNDQAVAEITASPRQAVLQQRQFDGYSRFIKLMNYMSTNYFAHELVYCAYFDKDNVQFVGDSVYRRYHEHRLLDGATVWPVKTDAPHVTGDVLRIPGQDYMAVTLLLDTIPHTPQTARYLFTDPDATLSAQEHQYRREEGLTTDYSPMGFYPLEYQGRRYLILPVPDSTITSIEIPLDYSATPPVVTLRLH
jgi:hypothetical protein